MIDPRFLSIEDYTYSLPEDKIAHYPLANRDESRLLIYKHSHIQEDRYRNLGHYLSAGSLLVFNNTKVVAARLLFQKATGATIELFCLEPDERYADITTGMLQQGRVYWNCLAGGAKKWKEEVLVKSIRNDGAELVLQAKKLERRGDHFLIEFTWNDASLSFAGLLQAAGVIPLPPYLNRAAETSDRERYQTIYASADGSVAAPTAGLHFTERLFADLAARHIEKDFVTLHVGAGTFKPVKTPQMQQHEMHAEFIEVKRTLVERLLLHDMAVAVGTTSLRTLESLYWMGLKVYHQPEMEMEELELHQWEAYNTVLPMVSKGIALQALLTWMDANKLQQITSKTRILIAPGYELKIARALITNFHQPKSTLLLLVAAITGNDWRLIYNYALEHEFRFLSYGDGCLLFA